MIQCCRCGRALRIVRDARADRRCAEACTGEPARARARVPWCLLAPARWCFCAASVLRQGTGRGAAGRTCALCDTRGSPPWLGKFHSHSPPPGLRASCAARGMKCPVAVLEGRARAGPSGPAWAGPGGGAAGRGSVDASAAGPPPSRPQGPQDLWGVFACRTGSVFLRPEKKHGPPAARLRSSGAFCGPAGGAGCVFQAATAPRNGNDTGETKRRYSTRG